MSASQDQKIENTCANPGNPVFTCMMPPAGKDGRPWLRTKHQNPLYRTSYSDIGRIPPTYETAPCTFHPKSQKFSAELGRAGPYRDTSFNTALDRSRVNDRPSLHHTI